MMIDAHAHLGFLTVDRAAVEIETSLPHIQHWILAGYNSIDWHRQMQLKSKYPNHISTCLGLHPWVICDSDKEDIYNSWGTLVSLASQADFIGEVGLDTFTEKRRDCLDIQREFYRRQLQLADDFKKPVVIHAVGAWGAVLEELDICSVRGFVHGFTGSLEMAREFTRRGLKISIGPDILKNSFKKLRQTAKELELKYLLVETDSPSSTEDSKYAGVDVLNSIIDELSQLRGDSEENVKKALYENSCALMERV